MTTRKEQLLRKLGYADLVPLPSLSHDDALSLFAQHALGVDNFDSHPTLKPHGEGFVKKCDGLPLALISLGRLLRTKKDEEEWKMLLDSEIWRLENEDEIVPALRLSSFCLFEAGVCILLLVPQGLSVPQGGVDSVVGGRRIFAPLY
ncbi:unnamed protein product [Lactuca virosa]|nr:unnamed protein product [Lactuca virosa]